MGRLESLSSENAADVLSYLARRPYENVYVYWLVATGQIGRGGSELLVWRDGAARVRGVCYAGAQIVPCADEPVAFDAFAERLRDGGGVRMIVGPRAGVERFWARARRRMRAPSAVRASQPLYALEAPRATDGATVVPGVARATHEELDEIVLESARMIAGELGGDPERTTPEFRARTARIIQAGWWWRYRVDGRLAFMCNVGSTMPATAQLQGVWTPLPMRGHGHASLGLAAICARLFATVPSLCLFVNDFNVAAIALYERVGFARVGEFQTFLF